MHNPKLLVSMQLQAASSAEDCQLGFMRLACNATAEQRAQLAKLGPVLVNAAKRCVGYQPPASFTCPSGEVLPVAGATAAGPNDAAAAAAAGDTAAAAAHDVTHEAAAASPMMEELYAPFAEMAPVAAAAAPPLPEVH